MKSNITQYYLYIFFKSFFGPLPLSLLLRSITEHIDFATPIQEPAAEPLCNANLAASMHTLDHLAGVANRAAIHYTGESQLREVGLRGGEGAEGACPSPSSLENNSD